MRAHTRRPRGLVEEDEKDVKSPRNSGYKRRRLIKTEDMDDDADADVCMLADNEESRRRHG